MDPNQREDTGWHTHLLLLHLWSDDPGRACLLAERLEEVAGGRVRPTLPVLCLQLVSSDCQKYVLRIPECLQTQMFCSLIGQVVLRVGPLVGSQKSI